MRSLASSVTIGVEEECILVDPETGLVVTKPSPEYFKELSAELGDLVSPEALASVVETRTNVCSNVTELREEMIMLRSAITRVADKYKLAPLFASIHPFGRWRDQVLTRDQKYLRFAQEYQRCENRAFVVGMHIHVGVEDVDQRIRLLNELIPYLSIFLALSTSSPFWNGEDTGLNSYRTAIWHDLPRTGLPPIFKDAIEYDDYIQTLLDFKIVKSGNEVWWDIRPNANNPTLELRICDICTELEDAVAITALFQCLCLMLEKGKIKTDWQPHRYAFARENIWQAQRRGVMGKYVQQKHDEKTTHAQEILYLVEKLKPYAAELGCEAELAHLVTIIERGTSAEIQRRIFFNALQSGANEQDALQMVVAHLIESEIKLKV